jgi:MFS family permease
MTALSGAAMSYWQLLLARIGVGVGEAGASPPSHSIISDYYEPSHRPLALSIWALGTVIGSLAGLILGGYIAEHYGWRWAFVAAGLPGLALAIVLKFTVREPPRGNTDKLPAAAKSQLGFWASIVDLWKNRIYRHATVAHVISVFFGYSLAAWLPAFFIRQWGLTTSEVGVIVGTTVAIAGVGGLLIGGAVTSWLSKRFHQGWEAWMPAIVLLAAAPAVYVGLNAETAVYGAVFIGAAYFLYQCMHGSGLAIVQSSVAPNKRAFAAAVMYFVSNITALGLGPLFVGYISDLQLGDTAGESLKIGLYIGPIALVLAAASYWHLGFRWRDAGDQAPQE